VYVAGLQEIAADSAEKIQVIAIPLATLAHDLCSVVQPMPYGPLRAFPSVIRSAPMQPWPMSYVVWFCPSVIRSALSM
jgi:hypothetical protein